MGCLRLFRRLCRRSSQQDDSSLGPRPYHKHKHSPSADSSFSTDFAEKVSYSDSPRYRGSSRTGSVAVPVTRPNVNPAYSAYATPEIYRYGGAGPREDGRTPGRSVNGEKKEVEVDSAEEQERLDFLQMM